MRAVMIFAAIWSAGSAAFAQGVTAMPDTVTPVQDDLSLPAYQEQLNQTQVREAMLKFASCVLRRHPRDAEQYVVDATRMMDKKWDRILDSDCLVDAVSGEDESVEMQTHNTDMRFALAQVLVTKKLAAFNPADIRSAGPLPAPTDAAVLASVGGYVALDALGECVVRANPESARTLLVSPAATKQEALAMQMLMPAFGQCVPQGRQFKANLPTLRGLVAIAYYRLATAPKAARKSERG